MANPQSSNVHNHPLGTPSPGRPANLPAITAPRPVAVNGTVIDRSKP